MDKILHRLKACMTHNTILTSPHTHSEFIIGGPLTYYMGNPT